MKKPILEKRKLTKQTLFAILTGVFTACLVVSNIIAGRIWSLGFWDLTLPAAVFLFPITYIINDIMAEVYGFSKFKKIVWLGFGINLLFVGVYTLMNVLPTPIYMQETANAFQIVLGTTARLLTASLLAYVVGGLVNGKTMDLMHQKFGEKGFNLRAVISTLFGEGIDSMIFITIAFIGVLPLNVVVTLIIAQATFKTIYEIICLPLTNKLVKWVKQLPETESI